MVCAIPIRWRSPPTATISNIAGCYPCIEPIYKNLYVKANMSGEFTVVNRYLVKDLKKLGLCDEDMLERLKYYDGSVARMDGIPDEHRALYKEASEIDPLHLIRVTAARSKWIDQSQSHNVFMRGSSGKVLDQIYMTAWETGLKSTYYLRTLGASQIEKSTVSASRYGYTQKRVYEDPKPVAPLVGTAPASRVGPTCSVLDPECKACQ
jgi:ribonucleoside-diphosphate reductase alpha chain